MKEGEKSRKVGATNMNERSSRSHTIFRIKLESTNRMDEDDTMVLEEEDGGESLLNLTFKGSAGSKNAKLCPLKLRSQIIALPFSQNFGHTS